MSFLNKVYFHDKDDNFEEFVDHLGLPEDKKKEVLSFKSTQCLKKDGDQYILSTTTPSGNKDFKFKDGVEFDEEPAPGLVAKSKFTVDGNVVTQSQTYADGGSLTYRREFSDDQLVVVITTNKWDGIARRYFKTA